MGIAQLDILLLKMRSGLGRMPLSLAALQLAGVAGSLVALL